MGKDRSPSSPARLLGRRGGRVLLPMVALLLSFAPAVAIDALSPAELQRRAAQSPLERAIELEENFHFQEAFDAYEDIRKKPGPPGDIADAEIGAAKCLHRWAGLVESLRPYGGLKLEPGERAAPPDDSLARLETAARKWAGTPQEPKVLLALARRESTLKPGDVPSLPKLLRDHRERALAGYERIAATTTSPSEAVEAELGAASASFRVRARKAPSLWGGGRTLPSHQNDEFWQ